MLGDAIASKNVVDNVGDADNYDLIQGASLAKTGNFTRKAAGGSFQVGILPR